MKHAVRGRSAGYTLVEMVIVLVILGVTAAMGFPRFATEIRHQRVNHAADVVASDLELAGALAAQKRQAIEMRFDTTVAGYTLALRNSPRPLLRRSLGSGSDWRVAALQATPPSVDFLPAGTVSAPLLIVVGAADYNRTVTITRAGLVRVRR